jgi:hydrogenase maturation factor
MRATTNGILTCARYAFAPNYFHYCGPEKQRDLQEYIQQHSADRGLTDILHHFETLYPYLLLIASSNRIKDPFDPRVVEAYWLGNALLRAVKPTTFAIHLSDTLSLKKKIPKKHFTPFMEHAMRGIPNHNEHVFNIFIRTGHATLKHTISTMDSCRISWGKVKDRLPNGQCIVSTRPLSMKNDSITLDSPITKTAVSIGIMPQKGQYVSLHWGYACEILTASQLQQLQFFTAKALERTHSQESIVQ